MSRSVSPGRVLGGRYHLTRELARGGMATVWDARDPLLSRRVAVKILHPELAIDDSLRARFRKEAIAAAKLSHPAIVATYDTGDDDVAYIVMQLVEGPTLRRMLDQRGPLPVGEAADIAAQVAEALDHSHQQGLVHRDIKPANVLVPPDGQIKVTDFGIAKATGDEDLTRTGTVVGTARYLAPEQVNGAPVDGRSDVYSLGLVFYEMLTGGLPFSGDSELSTAMARLTNEPEPVRKRRREVDATVDAIVSRCLAREPDDRFPTAGALADALEPVREPPSAQFPVAHPRGPAVPADDPTMGGERTATTPSQPPRPQPPRPGPSPAGGRRRRWSRMLLAVLLVAAVGAAAYAGVRAIGGDGGDGDAAPAAPAGPLPVVAAFDFDPLGDDGQENPQLVDNARDGNPDTTWDTQTYNNRDFDAPKTGVGLVLELDAEHDIAVVEVATDDTDWNGEIYVSGALDDTIDAWGTPVAGDDGLGTLTRFETNDARGRYVLVWITRLPADGKLGISAVTIGS